MSFERRGQEQTGFTVTKEYRARFPRRKIVPPSHTRAVRVRRYVEPDYNLGLLLNAARPFTRGTGVALYDESGMALTLLESRSFLASNYILSPQKIEILTREVEDRLRAVGGLAAIDVTVCGEKPLELFGNEMRPKVAINIVKNKRLYENARVIGETVSDALGVENWDYGRFKPHISIARTKSSTEGEKMLEGLAMLELGEMSVKLRPAQVMSCLGEWIFDRAEAAH